MAKKRALKARQREELLEVLRARFERNMQRHKGVEWQKVAVRLQKNAAGLWSLNEMENTGGEPDVVGHATATGEFDTKTSSWVRTPPDIRGRGGALFCDRRYGHVFTYHNGAQSYYAARAFRGSLRI